MTSVVFEEIPDKLTLAVSISNCQGTCEGCHSPFLRADIGEELTPEVIDFLIDDNFGVNCFLFLGEGNDIDALIALVEHLNASHPKIDVALYSGLRHVDDRVWDFFDYVKTGPYKRSCGPLNAKTTNQRLYRLERGRGRDSAEDITFRFWHKGTDPYRQD